MNLKTHVKETLKLSIPLVIGQLGQMMMGVVDSLMVGQLGSGPLAAVAVGNALFMIIQVFGVGVALAIAPMAAKKLSSNRPVECGVVLRQGLVLNFFVGLVLMTAAYFGADLIAFLNQDPEVEVLGIEYSRILAFSVMPFMIFFSYKNFTEGVNQMMPAMIIAITANVVNVFANYTLIFGNFGFEALGVAGAGWATFYSRLFMMIVLVLVVRFKSSFKIYDPTFHYRKLDMNMMKNLLKVGSGSGFQYLFEVGAFATAAFIIGVIGKIPQAAHQIAINLVSITYMMALGVSMAVSIRIGQFVGANDKENIYNAGKSSILIIMVIMGVNGIVLILFNEQLPYFYINELPVIEIASGLLIIAALFQLSDGIQAVAIGILRGLSDAKWPTLITLIAYWIISLPLGVLLAFYFDLGVYGIWIGLLIGLTLSAILLTMRFRKLVR